MKFEEALSTYDNRVYSIDEIFWLYHNNKTAYAQCLYGTLICPECKEAALSCNNAKVPYFKAYPNSAHGEHCSLRQALLHILEQLLGVFSSRISSKRKVRNPQAVICFLRVCYNLEKCCIGE